MKLLSSQSEYLQKRSAIPALLRRPSILACDPALRKRPASRLSPEVLTALQPVERTVPLFQILAEVSRTQSVALKIPETLEINDGAASQTLMYTRTDGFLSFYRGI